MPVRPGQRKLTAEKNILPDPILPPGMKPVSDGAKELGTLLEKLYLECGADFRKYNRATLARRLNKRLQVRQVSTYAEYAKVLDRDPGEYEKLLDVFTVNQTNFFRNPYVFEVLRKKLGALVEKKYREKSSLRIWCAGCSRGQEPYSLAILLAEIFKERDSLPQASIIASDIDSKVLAYAGAGIYTQEEAESLPETLRARYMRLEQGRYHCLSEIKQLITFKQHNMASDPPFKEIDLLVCRNVIIYFLGPLQMQVFRLFHQSLKANGLLLLGDSEIPMREARGLFTCLDFEAKLYRKALPTRSGR